MKFSRGVAEVAVNLRIRLSSFTKRSNSQYLSANNSAGGIYLIILKVVILSLFLPIFAQATDYESYQRYFAERNREEQAERCAEIDRSNYEHAYEKIAQYVAKFGAKIVGGLTKPDLTECQGLVPFYATLDNEMRCSYNPLALGANRQHIVCK